MYAVQKLKKPDNSILKTLEPKSPDPHSSPSYCNGEAQPI